MKNKFISLITSVLALFIILSGCAIQSEDESGKINVICTVFAPYDWTRELVKGAEEDFSLTLLSDNGADIHNYQPSADDIIKISTADIVIYIGGESDSWVGDALENADTSVRAVNMLDIVGSGTKTEEYTDGMEDGHDHASSSEYDEHVWLSLKNAGLITESIAQALSEVMPEKQDLFYENEERYQNELSLLDGEYKSAVENAAFDTLIFTDRFPFRYLVDDYGINYYAAFPGCSAESEASFETVAFLAQKLDELKLPAVIIIDGGNESLAETVIENTADKDQKILSLDSLQSVTQSDIDGGKTYLSAMRDNLSQIKQAFGE